MVANGREAIEEYGSNDFDLAILDVQMPELDGFSVTAFIRREEAEGRPHLPLVALTAHAMPGDRDYVAFKPAWTPIFLNQLTHANSTRSLKV